MISTSIPSRSNTQRCAEEEQCFTELHPQYIKRGCTIPVNLNRTFVCRCPLCNDKDSDELINNEYKMFRDWEYDNKRLLETSLGTKLLCKVCVARGINNDSDKKCALGQR